MLSFSSPFTTFNDIDPYESHPATSSIDCGYQRDVQNNKLRIMTKLEKGEIRYIG